MASFSTVNVAGVLTCGDSLNIADGKVIPILANPDNIYPAYIINTDELIISPLEITSTTASGSIYTTTVTNKGPAIASGTEVTFRVKIPTSISGSVVIKKTSSTTVIGTLEFRPVFGVYLLYGTSGTTATLIGTIAPYGTAKKGPTFSASSITTSGKTISMTFNPSTPASILSDNYFSFTASTTSTIGGTGSSKFRLGIGIYSAEIYKSGTLSSTQVTNMQYVSSTITSAKITDGTLELPGTTSGNAILINNSIKKSTIYSGQLSIGVTNPSPSYKIAIGCSGSLMTYMTNSGSSWSTVSDIRDKTDFKRINNSLNFVNSLKPVTFVDNPRDRYIDSNSKKIIDHFGYHRGLKKGTRRIAGFKAQEVLESVEMNNKNTIGLPPVVSHKRLHRETDGMDIYELKYAELIPYLVGAVNELTEKIKRLKKMIYKLENAEGENNEY